MFINYIYLRNVWDNFGAGRETSWLLFVEEKFYPFRETERERKK